MEETETALEENLRCAVCRCIFVKPRIYEKCGHTICEMCMMRSDLAAIEEAPLNTLAMFRCPICRTGSFLPFQDRPVNHVISAIVESRHDYADRLEETKREMSEFFEGEVGRELPLCTNNMHLVAAAASPPTLDGGGDDAGEGGAAEEEAAFSLPVVCKLIRRRKALALFRSILPAVKNAAYKGKSRLSIVTMSRELSEMASDIAPMLFAYGVHSVVASSREFVVVIMREERSNWSGEYVNTNYDEPPSPTEDPGGWATTGPDGTAEI